MFKQIATLGLPAEIVQPFCIEATEQNDFLVASKLMVHCCKLNYQPDALKNSFDLSFAKLPCPKACPTQSIPTDEVRMFANADRDNQNEVLLDQTLLPQLSQPYVQTKSARWSPFGVCGFNERLVAYLNTFGGFEVSRRERYSRMFVKCIDISEAWVDFVLKSNSVKICQEVDELKRLNADIVITSFSWKPTLEQGTAHIIAATRSGKLTLWSVRADDNPLNLEMVLKTDLRMIQAIKWVTVAGKDYVVAGNFEGRIELFEVVLNPSSGICVKLEKRLSLWDSVDRIIVGHIVYESVGEQVLITCVKGTYLVFFLVNCSDGSLMSEAHEYIGSMAITGLQRLQNLAYIVVTYQNTIVKVVVRVQTDHQLSFAKTVLTTDMGLDKFAVYGVAASRNLSCWLFVTYPRQNFDHLTLRQPLQIFVCSLEANDAYEVLKQNASLSMGHMQDCAEVVRYLGLKDVTTTKALEASAIGLVFLDFRITAECLYKLRLYLLGMVARTSYYRYRNFNQANVFVKCCNFLESVLNHIRCYQILQRLHAHYLQSTTLTPQQYTTAKYLRTSLINHTANDHFEELREFQAMVQTMMELLIHETAYLDTVETKEPCLLCGSPMQCGEMVCASDPQHLVSRCAFTKMQVPFLKNYRRCGQCNRILSLNDQRVLDEVVLGDPKMLTCPICDTELTTPRAE